MRTTSVHTPTRRAAPTLADARGQAVTVSAPTDTTGPLATFSSKIPMLWPDVAPFCAATGIDGETEVETLRAAVVHRRAGDPTDAARRPGDELEALLAGWAHFDAERRAVLRGAVRYLQEQGDRCRSGCEEHLVDAAVLAVLRSRG